MKKTNEQKKLRKAFTAGFDAGYAKGQNDAGEGGYWLIPPDEKEAWKQFLNPIKIKKSRVVRNDPPF